MATPPRQKGNSGPNNPRATARGKKPSTIDLDASEVKDTSATAKAATTKTVPVTARTSAPAAKASPEKKSKTASSSGPSGKNTKPAKADTKAKSESPKSEGNKNGFGRLAAAGIIGGVITLGGAGAMQYSGMLPNLGELPAPAPVVDLQPLQGEIETLRSRLETVEVSARQTGASEVDLTPLESRISELENKPVLPVVSGNGEPGNSAEVEKLRLSLNDIASANEALNTRIAALESSGLPLTDRSAITTAINSAIAPLSASSKQTVARLQELETNIAALTKRVDEDVDARISAFGKKLENAATGEKLAKSVAINALKSSIENGQPFSAALTSLETLAGSSNQLEKLKPFAITGIATNKQLREEFGELQSSILRAATNDPEAGISQRLMASIQSLVTISSSEALAGGTPEAIISRINANLKSENFGAAISEWKTLPAPAQKISSDWVTKLEQRMDADRQVSQLLKNLQSGN